MGSGDPRALFQDARPAQSLALGAGIEFIPRRGASLGDRRRSEISGTERSSTVADAGHIDRRQSEVFLHTEAVYEAIHLGGFHFGPVVGYAWTRDHSHVSAGIHAAFAF